MDDAIEGHSGALTPPAPAAGGAELDQAPIDAADELGLQISPQLDLLATAAETSNAARRGAGRPRGSLNKRNAEAFDYFEALGFKAPERRLLEIVSADPRQLAAALAGHDRVKDVPFDRALKVLKLQIQAAADLLPYKMARRPQSVEVTRRELHLFVAGNLTDEQATEQLQQNQWDAIEGTVRQPDNETHAEAIPQQDQGDR